MSPTWANDLDPDSVYGLHQRKGLEPVLRPETRVLTEADASAITTLAITNRDACVTAADVHPLCEFALSFTTLPDGVTVGAVLNSGITPTTPDGLLVKVTAIDGLRVSAVQATLAEALVQGELWVEHHFSSAKLRAEPTLAPGVSVKPRRSGGLRKAVPAGLPTFDQLSLPGELAIDVEPVDGVRITGSFDFGAGCGLDAGVGGSDVAWMEISCHAWQSASLSVTSSTEGPVSAEQYPVGYFPLAAIPIPIGPLIVVVVADIVITVDLAGQVHAGLAYSGHETASVRGGLKFSVGNGLDHDGAVDTSAGGSGGLAKDASVRVLGRAELRLSAYGVLGISVGGDTSLRLSGGPNQQPRWQLTANAGLTVAMFLGLLGWKLTASISYHLKKDFVAAAGGNSPPKLTVSWPTDGTVIILTGMLPRKAEAKATDTEDGSLSVRWFDAADNVTKTGGSVQLPFTKLGPHQLTVSATDSGGLTATKTLTVTVKPPSLSLSLRVLRGDGTAFDGQPAAPAGGTVLVEAVPKSGQVTPPDCASLSWTATNATVTTDASCRARVLLGETGPAAVSARITDSFGTSAEALAKITVTAPATAPEFLGIDAVANGRHLSPGDQLLGSMPVQLSLTYLNPDQAKVAVRFQWTVAGAGGPQELLPGASDANPSTLTFIPPTPWGYRATFTVVVTDAASKAVLTKRTFAVTWQSQPK